ncbi:hypothetical protein Hanom_Chr12g01069661 [Helianthus anomalus]
MIPHVQDHLWKTVQECSDNWTTAYDPSRVVNVIISLVDTILILGRTDPIIVS